MSHSSSRRDIPRMSESDRPRSGHSPSTSSYANKSPTKGAPSATGPKPAGGWAPNRTSASTRRSYRSSNMRQSRSSRSSRAGDVGDGSAPIKVIDEDGVNRTPKPLTAILPSAALRQAKPLGDDGGTLTGEASYDGLVERGLLSSSGFSRGWFSEAPSGAMTPSGEGRASEAGGWRPKQGVQDVLSALDRSARAAASAVNAPQAAADILAAGLGGMHAAPDAVSSPDVSTTRPLTQEELDEPVTVTLTETASVLLLELQGLAVAADSNDGQAVAAANRRYKQLVASREAAADTSSASEAQTLPVLLKHKEVQCGSTGLVATGTQASGWDIADTLAGVAQQAAPSEDDDLPGSVLPAGAAIPTGAPPPVPVSEGSSFMRTSHTFASSSNLGSSMGRESFRQSSSMGGFAMGRDSRSSAAGWGLPSGLNSGSGQGGGVAADAAFADLANAAAAAAWKGLPGLGPLLQLMDLALAQNTYLPQLLLYRDVKLPPPPPEDAAANPGATGLASSLSRGSSSSLSASVTASISPSIAGAGAGELPGMTSSSMLSRGPSMSMAGGMDADYTGSRNNSMRSLQASGRGPRGHRVPATMQLLWTFTCPAVEGLMVTALAWNHANPDLLAVGYRTPPPQPQAAAGGAEGAGGSRQDTSPGATRLNASINKLSGSLGKGEGAAEGGPPGSGSGSKLLAAADVVARGAVALWSLKNPDFPLWHFTTHTGVTALDFSRRSPHMLALGLQDGCLQLYAVHTRSASPVMKATPAQGAHHDPVWAVSWLDRGPDQPEVLISASTDGDIVQWTTSKGLEHTRLMRLKRLSRQPPTAPAAPAAGSGVAAVHAATAAKAGTTPKRSADGGGQVDAFISRSTGGMSFAFSTKDTRLYLAGTEDGWIHQCSSSYSSQYLASYAGHLGPVYKLAWSPFKPDLFISASADWTVRLWQQGKKSPLLSFQAGNDEVYDVAWCPSNSTAFVTATAGGRVELWDFSASTLRPVVQHVATKARMTAAQFAPNAPVVVAGNDSGGVLVFRLGGVMGEGGGAMQGAAGQQQQEAALARLEEVLRANVMKMQPTAGS